MRSFRLSKSTATVTNTSTVTSVTASGMSQSELAAGQRLQGSFTGLPTTVHTPESRHMPPAEQTFAGLTLLAEVSASQVDPFQALATHQSVTFDDDDQEPPGNTSSQSSRPLAIIGESSQPILDAAPNVKKAPFEIIVSTLSPKDVGDTKIRTTTTIPEQKILPSINDHFRQALSEITPEAVLTGMAGDPHLSSCQYPAEQSSVSTDKRIISTGDVDMPFQCGYESCSRKFTRIQSLKSHIISHTNDSEFRCYAGDCVGAIRYPSRRTLTRHIQIKHTFEKPYQCELCDKRFRRIDHLKCHTKRVVHLNKAAQQSSVSIDKWIISTGDADMPYQCGYEGCGKKFTRIQTLTSHIVIHTGDSRFRCYFGDCAGIIRYCHREELTRHIHVHHTFERPYPCEDCGMRFRRSDHLKSHKRKVHFIEDEKSSPKRKKK